MPTLTPLHQHLTFHSPLSEARAERLVAHLTGAAPTDALDLGCGWSELLLRVLAAVPGARGLGVDLDEEALAVARERALARGLSDRARFEARDARTVSGVHDAVCCIGASQIWGPPVEAAQPIGYDAALTALRALVRRGGRLVYGECIWSAPPTPAATAPLAGRDDECLPLGELVARAGTHGFALVAAHEATLDEWDSFESGYTACYADWLAGNPPDDAEAADVLARAARQHTAYFGGYRGILGFAYLELVAV